MSKAASNDASDAGKKLPSNIQNTMSDQAVTEFKWHELLALYRTEILPDVDEKWGSLSDEEKEVVSNLSSFFCGLHSLVQYAEVTQETFEELEKNLFAEKKGRAAIKVLAFKSQERKTRIIQTCASAFAS